MCIVIKITSQKSVKMLTIVSVFITIYIKPISSPKVTKPIFWYLIKSELIHLYMYMVSRRMNHPLCPIMRIALRPRKVLGK